jgi:hypothetical protein
LSNYPTTPPPPGYAPPPAGVQPEYTNLPPGKRSNGWAIASLICGILGCVPFLTGALAVIFGILGIRKSNDPQVNSGKGLSIAGLVLGVVSILGWAFFGAGIWALFSGTAEQRDLVRQFINDLAAGNVAAAQAKCDPNMPPEDVQEAVEAFKQQGAIQDITLLGASVKADTTTGTQTTVAGAVTFANNRRISVEATVVKQGDAYKITGFKFE